MPERLQAILGKDPRYAIEAYVFVFEALPVAQELAGVERHVTGRQLLDGILELARRRYGRLAKAVFTSWGVKTTDDFGAVVFNLVDAGLMSKTEDDTIEEFRAVYSFDQELVERYRIAHGENDR